MMPDKQSSLSMFSNRQTYLHPTQMDYTSFNCMVYAISIIKVLKENESLDFQINVTLPTGTQKVCTPFLKVI